MTKTKEQIRAELKAGYEREIAEALAAVDLMTNTETAEEAARLYLITDTVDYPSSPADKKAHLGAFVELATETDEVFGNLHWRKRNALIKALGGEFSIEGDQAARTRRDGLKKGFETVRTDRLRSLSKQAAKDDLMLQVKEFLASQGVAVRDDYTDDQLYALSQIKLESLLEGNTAIRRNFEVVIYGYFGYVDGW